MLFLALIALSLACSDNPSSPAPVLPALDASVEEDPLAQTWGEINLECPETTRPLTGRGAVCSLRTSQPYIGAGPETGALATWLRSSTSGYTQKYFFFLRKSMWTKCLCV